MKIDVIVLNQSLRVTFDELCELCRVSREEINEMVEEGIISPRGPSRKNWLFHGYDVKRVQIALRLQRDLQVNLPGVAVIIDLLEELDQLRKAHGKRT
jgi:chaperone modulatory protein CbpM